MSRTFLLAAVISSAVFTVEADDNFCRKCQVMREYHKKNPCQYEYYDDYLKDLEENGEDAVNPKFEDLPPDVQEIVKPGSKNKGK